MNLIKRLLADIQQRPSFYFFIFLIVFTVDRHHRYEGSINDTGTFSYDVHEYYRYLPDVFINNSEVAHNSINSNQRTIGMAIMYSPSFLVGHLLAKLQHEPQDGYSLPYQWAIRWGSIIYCILGLAFCRKNLLIFFSEFITLMSLIAVFFATNLLFYTYTWGEMPHSYLFFLYAVFIYLTLGLVRNKKMSFLPWLCFVGGFITLIRPTGIVVFLFPLFYDVRSLLDLKTRFVFMLSKPSAVAISFLLFFIPLLLQMLIWKKYHGQFVFYSYGEQKFFFADPKIIKFLVGIRKGWLVYTPVMAFAILGIAISYKRLKEFFVFLIIYFPITVYILSSWWDWSSGGSFGCRVLIESYAFLVFPLALFISTCWHFMKDRKSIHILSRALIAGILIFFIKLNFVQLWQCKYGLMHWRGNNVELYKYLFLKEDFTDADKEHLKELKSRFTPPDDAEMLKGNRDQ
jgi:hypothetical protein